jgi:predicted DNA repair protein MutK
MGFYQGSGIIRHNTQIHISHKITHHAQNTAHKATQTINSILHIINTKQKKRRKERKRVKLSLEIMAIGIHCADHVTPLYLQKLALTLLTVVVTRSV